MNGEGTEPGTWSRRRWWLVVAGLVFVQAGLICWFSDHRPRPPRPLVRVPHVQVAGAVSAEWIALTDPTLFALPHAQGFSGPAWLEFARIDFQPFQWKEPADSSPLLTHPSGMALNAYVRTNSFGAADLSGLPEPQLTLPPTPPPRELPSQSTFRLAGGLAGRKLLTPLSLPPQPPRTNSSGDLDILTNSVVQLLVDADGKPVSIALLVGSGSDEANRFALEQARAARFEPERTTEGDPGQVARANAPGPLSLGQIIFEWYTLPPPATAPPGR